MAEQRAEAVPTIVQRTHKQAARLGDDREVEVSVVAVAVVLPVVVVARRVVVLGLSLIHI
eukprot:9726148-Alexandrium_andersonii.AAC.1